MRLSGVLLLFAVLLSLVLPDVFGSCNVPRPAMPPDVPEPPSTRPPPDTPPESGPGRDLPSPGEDTPPGSLPTEGEGTGEEPADEPDEPTVAVDGRATSPRDRPAPPAAPAGPVAVPGSRPGTATPGPRRPSGMSHSTAWRVWWELSREHLLGLRNTLVGVESVSGPNAPDPLISRRLAARVALREVAVKAQSDTLRAAALRALGRVGDEEDARFLFLLMKDGRQPDIVVEGAALGLASLDRVTDVTLKAELRALYAKVLGKETSFTGRTRLILVMALSLRARDDGTLVRALGTRLASDPGTANEAAALLFSCGLTKDHLLSSELCASLTSGMAGGKKLHDVARAHAAMGLALSAESAAVEALAEVLSASKTGIHTRRAAAIALGSLLRIGELRPAALTAAREAVERSFADCNDPLVRGYCLIAMGTAREPFGLDLLVKIVDKTGQAVVKPFAALALGHAARRLTGREADLARRILVRELEKSRDQQLAAALSLAAGLARATDARPLLLARARSARLNPEIRGAAMEALGLLGGGDAALLKTLTRALEEKQSEVVEGASLALGFLGRPETARMLVRTMARTKSFPVRRHMVVALGHLGGVAGISPLLDVVADPSWNDAVRESAAEALGVLLSARAVDPLFEIDAACDPYSLTEVTRELVRIY